MKGQLHHEVRKISRPLSPHELIAMVSSASTVDCAVRVCALGPILIGCLWTARRRTLRLSCGCTIHKGRVGVASGFRSSFDPCFDKDCTFSSQTQPLHPRNSSTEELTIVVQSEACIF